MVVNSIIFPKNRCPTCFDFSFSEPRIPLRAFSSTRRSSLVGGQRFQWFQGRNIPTLEFLGWKKHGKTHQGHDDAQLTWYEINDMHVSHLIWLGRWKLHRHIPFVDNLHG